MSDDAPTSDRAPVGKLARLPFLIREEVNRRLNDGQPASKILPWLNAREEVRVVLAAQFDGAEVNAQNLSAWRKGGFQKWLEQRQEIEDVKGLTDFICKLVDASEGKMTDGAHALAVGRLLAKIQAMGPNADTDELVSAARAVATLAGTKTARDKLSLDERRTEQKERELTMAEEKHQRDTAEWYLNKVEDEESRAIATSGRPKETRIKELVQHWFGEMPEGIGPAHVRTAGGGK